MKNLFEAASLGGLKVKNRLFRSATLEGAGDDQGNITPAYQAIYETLAKGGVGAIITGMIAVDEQSSLMPRMVKTYRESFIPSFRQLADIVHSHDCRVIPQLAHCGVKASPDDGSSAIGPSDAVVGKGKTARAMTQEEIASFVQSYVTAALRCKEAGADAVQIHAAHGYLLSQFLSPYYNKRTDEYGGSIQNRARIVFEIYDALRAVLGPDYPILIKLNSEDRIEGGLTQEDSLWVCEKLEKRGIDAIEVSAGIAISAATSSSQKVKDDEDEGMFAQSAAAFFGKLHVPLISVGGYRTPRLMEFWLNQGNAHAISLCRALISEPDLPNRWQGGDTRKSRCVSCNKCFNSADGFGCKTFLEA